MNATRTDLLRLLHQGGYRNLRALSPSDFAPVETPNAAVENPAAVDAFADRHQAQHLFVGVAERLTADGGGSIENCGLLRALFVDIDDKQFADGETGSMRAIVDGPLLSSAMVRSGGGFQLYFALSEPLDLQNGGRPLATKLLKGLAHAYHGDTNAAEPARILRLPGTLNHKYDPPRPVTLEGLWTDRRYTLEQIERLLVTAGTTTAEAKPIEPLPILIDQGGRNALLFREACRLRRMGWGAGEILGALVRVNQRRCRPPLDHAELRGIAVSASRHDPAEDLFPATETGTAEFLETVAADTICFDHGRRGWYVFDGQHWTADTTEEIDRIALAAIRARQAIAVKLDAEAPGRADRIRWMVGSESRVRRDNIVRLAAKQSRLATSGDHWDTDRMLFGVANGNVDLRTGTLRPGQPSDRVTKVAPVVFDPDATCPRWERFLAEVFADDPDLPPYLQRVLGYALTGETSEQVFWILWGLGANGKSTLVEVLMTSVWGNAYAWTMPFPSASWSQSMTEYQKASLVGQRLVAASEVTKRGHLNDELIKSLTGGDTINARHPYGRPFHFAPMAKIFLRVNDKPVIRDQSHGMWRRVKLVPFTQMFKVDTSLMPTLLSEAPGILAWAVRGSVDWQRDGLRHPASVTAATADYQAESDVLSDFFAERCVIEASASVVGRDLFAAFCSWCDARQLPDVDRLSQTAFGLRIRARFPAVEGRQVRYRGIGLRLNAEFAFRTREVEF